MAAPRRPNWIATAIKLALLTIGFYAMAFGVAAVLAVIPYGLWKATGTVSLKAVALCGGGAALTLASCVPRRARFFAPGPRLDSAEQPEFMKLVAEASHAAGQTATYEVYLTREVEAGVNVRGGLLGFGRRRVLFVGLPAAAAVNVSEMRTILLHEFGRFAGGETKLIPWMYAFDRSLDEVISGFTAHGRAAALLWVVYGRLAMRLIRSASRAEAFAADAFAARLGGSRATGSALLRLGRAEAALTAFRRGEFEPALRARLCPPFCRGFDAFLAAPWVREAADEILRERIERPTTSPDDTHPPLKARLDAIGVRPEAEQVRDAVPAASLLRDLGRIERDMYVARFVGGRFDAKADVAWSDVAERVHVPACVDELRPKAELLRGLKLAQLPTVLPEVRMHADGMERTAKPLAERDVEARDAAVEMIYRATALALRRMGRRLDWIPGVGFATDDPRDRNGLVLLGPLLFGLARRAAGVERTWRDVLAAGPPFDGDLADAVLASARA